MNKPHYECYWCGTKRFRPDIMFVDDKPMCKPHITNCKEEYYNATYPKPVDRRGLSTYARREHG